MLVASEKAGRRTLWVFLLKAGEGFLMMLSLLFVEIDLKMC